MMATVKGKELKIKSWVKSMSDDKKRRTKHADEQKIAK